MSSTVQESSGIVVITQVVPQPRPMDSAQTEGNTRAASLTSFYPRPLQKFYKGEPKALGVTQILTGVIQILLGTILIENEYRSYRFVMYTGVPFWSGSLYIISGSLSVAASCNPAIPLVRASLAMNIISSIAAGLGIIIYITLSSFYYRSYSLCYYAEDKEECSILNFSNTVFDGALVLLLVLTILEFCVSISTSAFACKVLCRNAYSEVNVVIYQNTSPNPVASGLSPSLPPCEETKSY
uniref:Membrane-spanning 4-domains subfamily A member 4A-like n=1 Tax=Geotrypetes seraphini TaxID=260995 RepID=A0A6P8PQN1_GEOSA|nr:membrane-spanning 4-domains subfamily A member 4A-like [Geotrypetes seraphini]